MKQLKGSRTEANLFAAFAGEAQARTKYDSYAAQAKKEGFEQIAGILRETADNEREHAEIWLGLLRGGPGATPENLTDAAEGEHFEWSEMYRKFAAEAREEGFAEIASLFELVGEVEKEHETRYRKLIANVNAGEVFRRPEKRFWICRNCGHVHFGEEPPASCPVCSHSRAYFELKVENY